MTDRVDNDTIPLPEFDRPRSRKPLLWVAVLALGVVGCVLAFLLTRGSGPPDHLSPSYVMTFDNTSFDIQSDGSLTDVADGDGGAITGQMTVNPPLGGTGPFTGTYQDGTITFLGAAEGTYTGTVDSEGFVTGTYVYAAGGFDGQHGKWTATPSEKPSSGGLPSWLWLVAAAVLALIGFLIVRRGRRSTSGRSRDLPAP
jgi:hypothetical protein